MAGRCPSCDHALPPGARFCANCGARVAPAEAATYSVPERRTFGVLPGRSHMRAARTRAGRWWGVVRARVDLVLEVVAAKVEAEVLRLRIKRHASALGKDRAACLNALGHAVYAKDTKEVERVQAHVARLDRDLEETRTQLRLVDERVDERIARAKAEGGSTEMLEQPLPSPSPSPPIIPEPTPRPSEPPGPVIVPEPEPVPHEPPGPVIVPEPEPPAPS